MSESNKKIVVAGFVGGKCKGPLPMEILPQ